MSERAAKSAGVSKRPLAGGRRRRPTKAERWPARSASWTVIAQDPAVKRGGEILTARVEVPAERLGAGPRGYRVGILDYDATTGVFLRPAPTPLVDATPVDPYREASSKTLLEDPRFHAQNVYALVMRTLSRFEHALGRRISWGFDGQQIKVAPHAFQAANAFYSREAQGLLFGYFPAERGGFVYTCLAHDIVVHETTHAILDGLREHYQELSHPDQAAFHEGFADVVAILSVFSLPGVVEALLAPGKGDALPASALRASELRRSVLLGLAEQMGSELSAVRGSALRRSATLRPSPRRLRDPDFTEAHDRGEILVAAVINAFIEALRARMQSSIERGAKQVSRARVAEEAAAVADTLLTMVIRALDYLPPVDVRFEDYLAALLTSDREIRPDDSKYELRAALRLWFGKYGIEPPEGTTPEGTWQPAMGELHYDRTHFESIQRTPEEVFRFLWENRNHRALGLPDDAYTRVLSVRPCLRIAPDGFVLRETVVEYKQRLDVEARRLPEPVKAPRGMQGDLSLRLNGGGTLIFDEYGRLKYHVHQKLLSKRQTARLAALWESGELGAGRRSRFAALHLSPFLGGRNRKEAFR
jgi:hypothetical protein